MLRPAAIVWQLLPKLRFVQFPWRWMSILTVPFIYFLAAAFARRSFRWFAFIAAAAFLGSTAIFLVHHTWWDQEEFSTLRASIASGEGFDGTDEYDPIGDDHYNLPAKAPRVQVIPLNVDAEVEPATTAASQSTIVIERWLAEEKIIRVESMRSTRLALRLLNYPAWQLQVNGSRIQPESAEDSGQMVILVPAGRSRINIRFTRTPDRTAGIAISIASLFAALFLLWWGSRERRSQSA
jgi:hypothetical protein